MLHLRIAIATRDLRLPLRQALAQAAELAAQGVQLDLRGELPLRELSETAARQLRKLLADLNLRLGSVTFPTRRGFADPEALDRRVAATKEALHWARKLGSQVLIVRLGEIPEASDTEAWQTLLSAVCDLAAESHRVGALLAAKTSGATWERLGPLLEALPDGALWLDLDPAELLLAGREPAEVARDSGARVAHVTANDGVRELAGRGGKAVRLGRGSVEFPELLAALEEHDYSGWLTVERSDADDPPQELGDAVQYLERMGEGS